MYRNRDMQVQEQQKKYRICTGTGTYTLYRKAEECRAGALRNKFFFLIMTMILLLLLLFFRKKKKIKSKGVGGVGTP